MYSLIFVCMYIIYILYIFIHADEWPDIWRNLQGFNLQRAISKACCCVFLEVKVMKLRGRLTWPYGNPGIWSTFYLIFSKAFLCHLQWISWPPRSCLNPNWGNVFDGLDCFQRKWLVRKVAHAYCDFEDLLWHPDAKETQVNRKSPWLLGLGIFEKWPKRSTCKWKKHDQCNRSMGFDWHVNVISGF